MAIAPFPDLEPKSPGLFERDLSRTGNGFTALTLTASAQSYWLVERLFEIGFVNYLFTLTTSVMPFVLLCATFTFLYKFIPYTKVRLSSALVGGAVAGLLW